jgi:hypothetical protein
MKLQFFIPWYRHLGAAMFSHLNHNKCGLPTQTVTTPEVMVATAG